jgi:hypothetical protein
MKKRKLVFLSGAVWEIVRFALLYLLLLILMNPSFNIIGSILLVWFGTLHFLMAGLFFFLWIDQKKYSVLLPFASLGKGLNIVPAVLMFIMGTGLFQIGIEFFSGVRGGDLENATQAGLSEGSMGFLLLLSGIILFFDLIFFFILLSYTLNKSAKSESRFDEQPGDEHLPKWNDIQVEEE